MKNASPITIGIDLGGTRIKAIAIDASGTVLQELYTPTNDGDDKVWKQAVQTTVHDLCKQFDQGTVPVGLSAPGLPNADNSAIAFMPGRMQGLEHFNWSAFLDQPTFVLNDAVAAMMGEAKFGAAKYKKNVVMLTLGTGVGGAILINGQPYQGQFSKAGHIGHMVIEPGGEPDVTGMPGSLEECIGNCTIEKRTKGKYTSTAALLDDHRNGDEYATEVWLRSVQHLALGLASISNILSPELIVLGGGIAQAGDALFIPLQRYMDQYEWQPGGSKTPIVKAVYGDMAGAMGAAAFAMQRSSS